LAAFGAHAVLVSTADACAVGCPFCFRADFGHDVLEIPTYTRALSRLKELGFGEVCLTGGEPTDHAEFRQLVRLALQFGYACSVVTAARPGPRVDALASAATMLTHVTVSAASHRVPGRDRTGRTILSTLPVFEALGHRRASLHVTCHRLDDRDLGDIEQVVRVAGVPVEVSPLLPSPRARTFDDEAFAQDLDVIEERFGLSPALELLTKEYLDLLRSGERPTCRSERLYLSADGYLRRCPYSAVRQVSVLAPRAALAEGIDGLFRDPPVAGLSCLAICRAEERAREGALA